MRVIMYTAVLQTPVLLAGSIFILYYGLHELGHGSLLAGWEATKHAVGENLHLIRSNQDPSGPGSRFCRVRQSSASGIGAPTSTSSNAFSRGGINRSPGEARFSPAI